MKRFAIIMGAEEYDDFQPTPYCHSDAQLLRDTLVEQCDYAEQDVVLQLLSPRIPITPQTLLNTIREKGNLLKPDDTILFFYAGHGDVAAGEPYLILPSTKRGDTRGTGVALRDISEILRRSDVLNVRVFDCCHSGHDVRGAEGPQLDEAGFARSIADHPERGWMTFAACQGDQYSYPDSEFEHGIFTWAFAQSLLAFPDGERVIPELLKVKICDKVEAWATRKNRKQTPVFNSSIAGNVSIATRKVRPPAGSSPPTAASATPTAAETDTDIMSRLDALSQFPAAGTKEHRSRLKEYIGIVSARLLDKKATVQSFGREVQQAAPESAFYVLEPFSRDIVRDIELHRYRPLHNARSEQRTYSPRQTRIEAALGFAEPPQKTELVYTLDSSDWPEPCVTLRLRADGRLPGALLFFYLLPLQLRACLYSGIALQCETNAADDSWSLKSLEHELLRLDGAEKARIEEIVASRIGAFNDIFRAAVLRRVKVLEDEHGR